MVSYTVKADARSGKEVAYTETGETDSMGDGRLCAERFWGEHIHKPACGFLYDLPHGLSGSESHRGGSAEGIRGDGFWKAPQETGKSSGVYEDKLSEFKEAESSIGAGGHLEKRGNQPRGFRKQFDMRFGDSESV